MHMINREIFLNIQIWPFQANSPDHQGEYRGIILSTELSTDHGVIQARSLWSSTPGIPDSHPACTLTRRQHDL